MDDGIFINIKNMCFNCGGLIESSRLSNSLPCKLDIDDIDINNIINIDDRNKFIDQLYKILLKNKRLKDFDQIYNFHREVKEFSNFFRSIVNTDPWKVQLMWFKRLYKNIGFSMVAPTGVGKSTFIYLSSIYFSYKYKKKILIILPTRLLVKQTENEINRSVEKLNVKLNILSYNIKNKKEFENKLREGNIDILIISNQYLSKNFNLLNNYRFDIIFIDDVDSFFKGSKNIERVFNLIGYTNEDLDIVKKVIDLKLAGKLDFNSDIYKKFLEIKSKKVGIIVLSSATGSLKGKRSLIYKELTNFSSGTGNYKLRNVIDIYYNTQDLDKLYELVRKLKDGIIIFVSKDKGIDYVKVIYNFLLERGIKVQYISAEVKKIDEKIKDFEENKTDVLIGVADPYGILARGLNLPERIKYTIFFGIPKIRINLSNLEYNINNLILLGNLISSFLTSYERSILNKKIERLRNYIKRLSPEALRLLSDSLKNNNGKGYIYDLIKNIYNSISIYLKNPDIVNKLKDSEDVSITIEDNNIILNIVDIKTYLQASGRSSRLYPGGVSKGISIVLVDDPKLLKALDIKLRYILL
ncbi:reverse gyrase [Nanobdella aerobiophila]|uniref:Reverse gyrase n=1 Tax=Nanobdella aerobiophila TaxID=2586965 RepID=A0A915SIG5_9ARCH|nr:DEAD/DEAH box helicase [Nanobdella aerobiophila]BBL45617.1 reverse gyrase [Nanobdella aerobiophila]